MSQKYFFIETLEKKIWNELWNYKKKLNLKALYFLQKLFLADLNKQVTTNVPAKESSTLEIKTLFFVQSAPLGWFRGLPSANPLIHYPLTR